MATFLGVLGGMGPRATADFLRKLVESTEAATDQGHIPVILYGDCTTPDRTTNIEGNGPSPLPQLLEGVRFLNAAGVSAIAIPCNSAHHWYDQLQAVSAAPILHIARAGATQARLRFPTARKIGVLSTLGTFRMGLYDAPLYAGGYDVISPTESEFETLVSPGIVLAKADRLAEAVPLIEAAAARLVERGAEIIVLGCTEIPSILTRSLQDHPDRYIDSNDALVKAVIAHVAAA